MAAAVDLVVHVALERDGVRRVREIVAVPGRAEGDVIEIADLFVTRGGRAAPRRRVPAAPRGLRAGRLRRGRPSRPGGLVISPLCVGLLLGRRGLLHLLVVLAAGRRRRQRARPGGFMVELRDHLHPGGLPVGDAGNARRRLASCSFVIAFVMVLALTRVVPIALCFALMAARSPLSLVRMRARNRRDKLRDLWPDVVDNITSGVRAGLALPEALSQLAVRGPERAAAGLCRVRGGLPHDRALPRLPRPAQGPAQRPGGRPHRRVAADRARGRRQRPRPAAAHAVVVPARGRAHAGRARDATELDGQRRPARGGGARGSFSVCSRSTAARSRPTRSPTGWVVLAVGAGLCLVAYRAMIWIGRLPEEERVLR